MGLQLYFTHAPVRCCVLPQGGLESGFVVGDFSLNCDQEKPGLKFQLEF